MNRFALPGMVVAMAFALASTGCGKISAALAPAAERITKAFPVSDETSLAMSRYLDAAAQEGTQSQAGEQIERLLKVRALTCTASVSIGRFDTPENIRSKPVDAECLRNQDAEIAEWIGVQRLAVLLRKPALVALAPLGAPRLLPAYEGAPVGITTAAESNVAVMESSRGIFTAIRLPDGKALQAFKSRDFNRQAMSLSPNGRILMGQSQSPLGLKAFDVETGSLVWSSEKYRQLVACLPGVNALVAIRNSSEGGAALLDLSSGKASAYAIPQRDSNWAAALPGGSERILIGGSSTVSMVDHLRASDGSLSVAPVSQWRLSKQVSSGKPFLMGNGSRLVYVSHPGLGWLDLGNGTQGFADFSAMRANAFAKISESKIFFSMPDPGAVYKSLGRVIDIEASTLAPVTNFDQNDGLILSLAPRTGYMRSGHSTSVIGTEVEIGEAQDLQQAVAAANLELQLAKLKLAQEQQARENPPAMLGSSIPANAQVDVIGVYESKTGVHGFGKERAAGAVQVTVTPSPTPLVLVLSSYEPVRWVLQNPGRRKISAVLLSGYHESSVIGAEGSQVLRIGSSYAYKLDSPEYATLKRSVAQYVSNPVRTFQGAYSGQSFTVTASF